jgi:hypothetical protein
MPTITGLIPLVILPRSALWILALLGLAVVAYCGYRLRGGERLNRRKTRR